MNETVSLWWVTPVKVVKPRQKPDRERKRITLNVDTRIADALASIADRLGLSLSRVGELELSKHLVELGELPDDYKPLGETRGGDFTSRKKLEKKSDRTTTDEAD